MSLRCLVLPSKLVEHGQNTPLAFGNYCNIFFVDKSKMQFEFHMEDSMARKMSLVHFPIQVVFVLYKKGMLSQKLSYYDLVRHFGQASVCYEPTVSRVPSCKPASQYIRPCKISNSNPRSSLHSISNNRHRTVVLSLARTNRTDQALFVWTAYCEHSVNFLLLEFSCLGLALSRAESICLLSAFCVRFDAQLPGWNHLHLPNAPNYLNVEI